MRLIFLIIFLLLIAGCSAPPEDIIRAEENASLEPQEPGVVKVSAGTITRVDLGQPFDLHEIDMNRSYISIIGYTKKGSYESFASNWAAKLVTIDGIISGFYGEIEKINFEVGFQENSEVINTGNYVNFSKLSPIKIGDAIIKNDRANGRITINNVTDQIEYPVNVTSEGVIADFVLNIEKFKINLPKDNEEVRIKYEFYLEK